MSQDPEDISIAKQDDADDAHVRALGTQWCGKELEPFTPLRHAAIRAMGFRYGTLTPEEIITHEVETEIEEGSGRKKKKRKIKTQIQTYAAAYNDTILFTWICLQPENECFKALRKPNEALSKAYRWAEKEGLFEGSDRYEEAHVIFIQTLSDINSKRGEPVPRDNRPGDDDGDVPGE